VGALALSGSHNVTGRFFISGPCRREPWLGRCFMERERWNQWIGAAHASDLFEEPHGTELLNRLTGIDDDGFRSALAECMSCWALSHDLGLKIQPRPSGRERRILEFATPAGEGEICFEVKSPRLQYRQFADFNGPGNGVIADYSAALSIGAALRSANGQFSHTRRNVLVIAVPQTGNQPIAAHPVEWCSSIVRAVYGNQVLQTGRSAGAGNGTLADGHFLRHFGGKPRFTRIGAVIGLQEHSGDPAMRAIVLHNPYSENPIDRLTFGHWKQFSACGRPRTA
jgi:hypothetical protein